MAANPGGVAGAALPAEGMVVSRWTRLLENPRALARRSGHFHKVIRRALE